MANDEPEGEDSGELNVPVGTLIIDTYEIEELISVGGMGEVYRGTNVHTRDPVAIKIVLPALAHDAKISALFQKEARVLGRLNHDAIVRYHIFTNDKGLGRPCLVMEFVEGESLMGHLEQGPMPEDEVRRLIRRLAGGLQTAHEAGTVHRDLTPNNVILPQGSVDQAKIIDFGIAKSNNVGVGTVLQGQFAGTLNFVSPEQLGDFGGEIDARSDIYSMGLLAAAACRGETLNMGTVVVEAVNKRRNVPDISDVYEGLRPLLSRMLEPNPANRPNSMNEVIEFLDTPPEEITPVTPPEPAAPAPSPDRTVIAPMPSIPPAGSSQPPAQDLWTSPPVSEPPPQYSEPPQYSTPPVPSQPPEPAPIGAPGIGAPAASAPPGGLGAPATTPPPAATTPPPPQQAAYAPPPEKKKSSAGLIIGLVVLLAAAGGGYYAYDQGLIGGGGTDIADVDPTPDPPEVDDTPPEVANANPVASADRANTEAGQSVAIDVAANDRDPDGDALSVTGAGTASNGTVEFSGGSVTYTPNTGFSGTDRFSYSVEDGNGGTAQGSVTVTVAEPEKAPIVTAAENVEFLRNYNLGACTHLSLGSVTETSATVTGYGTSSAPFEKLLSDFRQSRAGELNVGVRIINDAQCAALDFVNALVDQEAGGPALIMDRDVLISGEQIRGTARGFAGKEVWLFLVDGDGGTYDITGLIEKLGENIGTFGMEIRLTPDSDPAPQLLVLVLSDKPIVTAAAVRNGSPARALLPLVLQEIETTGLDAGVALQFFRLEAQ